MRFKLPPFIRRLLKATSFWQENYLILREFKYFPWIAILAIAFPICAAAFEGFGIGFLLGFLQNLVSPNAEPFQTGIRWFDIWVLGINTSEMSRLYRVSALILATTWIRAGFGYLTYVYMEVAQLKLVDRLNKRIFEQLQALNLSYFGKSNSGEIIIASRLRLIS
jgi:subfamily B ATP-binding cassette protein MsbA